MTPRFLLDTNTVIHIRQRRPLIALQRFEMLADGEATLSVITYGELLIGIEKSVNREASLAVLQALTRLIRYCRFRSVLARHMAKSVRVWSEKGNVIGSNDLWIAAHALAAGLVLVMNNWSEFSRVSRLQLENWTT